MRKRALVIAAATALISLAAVESASAVVITQTQTVSNGFTTCRTVRQTALGPLGSAFAVRPGLPIKLRWCWIWRWRIGIRRIRWWQWWRPKSTCISNHVQRAEKPRT
jgi:hypothetical protein